MESFNSVAFDELPVNNDLAGNFLARICYAQNITLYQSPTPNDSRPRLVSQRDTLLMVQPVSTQPTSISVTGSRADGVSLGVLHLVAPAQLPAVDSPGNTNIIYAQNMWTVILPANWINPGLTLVFNSGNQSGSLNNIIIGAPNEIIFQTIDIGMLVAPRGAFSFAEQPNLHRDYYQKIPVSRLIVGEYEPVHFTRVVMPNGTLYTSQSATIGTWHEGDMRQYIAKILISQGINFANYGINSSDASREIPNSYVAFQITAHNARGRYQNGIIVHGGSGGNGVLTIDNSLGNEWSHEAGHAYSLGHYPGEWRGSTHQRPSPNGVNAAWGWDRHINRFIANFFWDRGGNQDCCGGSVPPFQGNRFNTDAMAGGVPSSPLSYYTLHTPYVLNISQNYIERHAVFSRNSPTGFKIWDPQSLSYIDYVNHVRPPSFVISRQNQFDVVGSDPNGDFIRTQLLVMGSVQILPSNGNWTRDVRLPVADDQLEGVTVFVDNSAQYSINIHIGNLSHAVVFRHTSTFVVQNRNWAVQVNNAPFYGKSAYFYTPEVEAPTVPHYHHQDCGCGCCSASNTGSDDFENCQCGVKTPNGSPYSTMRLPFYPPVPANDNVYRIDSQAQLALLANDPLGTHLHGLLQTYPEVDIVTRDGVWISQIAFPAAEQISGGRIISFINRATWNVQLIVNGSAVIYRTGDAARYVAENNLWRQLDETDPVGTRVPRHFGVPVTTLVGYYDPEKILPSTIYSALHGGYGFVYSPSRDINPESCYLRVTTARGPVHYQLARGRINPDTMNKFHVNIRQTDLPSRAEIVVRNVVVATLALSGPTRRLGYTVNGVSSTSLKYINGKDDITELNDLPEKLADYLAENFTVRIQLNKTDRLNIVKLPLYAYEGQRVEIAENAGAPIDVILDDEREFIVARGEVGVFIFTEDSWQKEVTGLESLYEGGGAGTDAFYLPSGD